MYKILTMLTTLCNFNTDDYVWINYAVTRFRNYARPYLQNNFDANCVFQLPLNGAKLFIGTHEAACCKTGLDDNKIGSILSCVNVDPQFDGEIKYLTIPMRDSVKQSIEDDFGKATKFIDEGLREGRNVLVHCFYGKSRSTSMVLAYLILFRRMTYEQALSMVKESRPLAQPNERFERELRFLSDTVCRKID